MEYEKIEFLSAVLLVSEHPEWLATFYRDVVGLPLEREPHAGPLPHYGCLLGDIHFAIYPVADFPDKRSGVGAVKLAFTVFDMQGLVERLAEQDIPLLYPPKNTGFFWTTAITDPDGNFVEFTQLSDEWFQRLEERRAQGFDILARWKETKQLPSPHH